jgi:hypothetical protein
MLSRPFPGPAALLAAALLAAPLAASESLALAAEDELATAFSEEWAETYAAAPEAQPAAAAAEAPAAPAPRENAAPSVPADSLLPSSLGPMEHVFWGRRGLMRHIGFPLTEESRERELGLRRGMLTAHQVGGFLTLAAMTATAVTGQMILNGRDDLGDRKRLLVTTTIAGYFATAALAMLTPPPMIRRKGISSITVHKGLALVHFTGMIITPILGSQIKDDYDKRYFHQISGYTTLGAFAGAMLVVTFW